MTRKKTFRRIFSYPIGCGKKALSDILASSLSWKNSKHVKAGLNLSLSLNLQGFILDSGFSETLLSQYMSLWIKIVVILNVSLNYISCLECLSRSLAYHFAGRCSQSYMNIACRSTQNAACTKWIWCFKSKMILRPLPTSVHSNAWQLALQVWRLAKFISGWADGWFIESLRTCILHNSRMTWLLNSPV